MDAEGATRRTRRTRTVKSCGSGVAVLALSWREVCFAGDGGKRAVLRGEHEVSRKAIAQGRPECSRCPVCSCAVLFAQIARGTAGAASTRSSLRPLIRGGQRDANLGRNAPRDREVVIVGWVERSDTHRHTRRVMGSLAPPILRDVLRRERGRGAAVSKGEATGPNHFRGHRNPDPSPRNRPACLDFRQSDFPLVT